MTPGIALATFASAASSRARSSSRPFDAIRHAETAADVDVLHVRETLHETDEHRAHLRPVVDVEHAAAGMRMQAVDGDAARLRQPRDLIELFGRNAELRLGARGLHVVVMAAADAGVDAQEHALALEGIEPVLQHEQVVDGHVHAQRERALVLGARREVRREQDAIREKCRARPRARVRSRPAIRNRSRVPRPRSGAGFPDADWP